MYRSREFSPTPFSSSHIDLLTFPFSLPSFFVYISRSKFLFLTFPFDKPKCSIKPSKLFKQGIVANNASRGM